MSIHRTLKKSNLVLLSILILHFATGVLHAKELNPFAWQTIETQHTRVRYQSIEDLREFSSVLKYNSEQWGLKRLFAATDLDGLSGKVTSKVDAIFERVQEILDMHKKMEKININIYHDKSQLNHAFYNLFQKECRIRAWYIHEFNTIYVQINDLHTGMLAHEMAHAIIDHYLVVRPPSATAEILARYVDSHLFSQ